MFRILSVVLLAVALTGSAGAVQLFDFDGQTILPGAVGDDAVMYARIVNGTAVATPLPLDFANYEYTLVVTGLTMDSMGATSAFSGGTVIIYKDQTTASDWANPATFSDGVAILSGSMASFTRTMFTATLGSGLGYVDWTGGTRLNDLAPSDQSNWPFLTGISGAASQVEPGFTEKWDGKIEPLEDVVGDEDTSWSALKTLYR